MKKRINGYLDYMNGFISHMEQKEKLSEEDMEKCRAELKHHLVQTSFFQHERLVHLLIMLLFAVLTFTVFGFIIFSFQPMFLVLQFALFILLIPYIMHYYLLENSVQTMYTQYDRLIRLSEQNPDYLKGITL